MNVWLRLALPTLLLLTVVGELAAHDPLGSDGHAAVLSRLADLPVDVVTRLAPAGATGCDDGSAFSFLVRRGSAANERRVIVDFMGGGAWHVQQSSPQCIFQGCV